MLHFWVVWIEKHKIRIPNLKNVCYIFEVFDVFLKNGPPIGNSIINYIYIHILGIASNSNSLG